MTVADLLGIDAATRQRIDHAARQQLRTGYLRAIHEELWRAFKANPHKR
jgi:hypothetical protein